MLYRTKQGLTTLRRAHEFLTSREITSDVSALDPHIKALAEFVTRLENHGREQDASDRAWRAQLLRKDAAGTALRQVYLAPLSRLARSLFHADATLTAGFAPSRARDHEGVLQAASGMAELAAAHQEKFIARGFTPDFVERLRSATTGFRQAILDSQLLLARRVAATAGLEEVLRQARQHLRLIDALIAPRLANQREQLVEWRALMRQPRRGVTPSEGEDPITPEVKAAA